MFPYSSSLLERAMPLGRKEINQKLHRYAMHCSSSSSHPDLHCCPRRFAILQNLM